jgi:hypothetical protein
VSVARRRFAPRLAALALIVAALALAGCGGSSGVTAAAYVHSMCSALGNWKNDIQQAGAKLQSSGAGTASRPMAKRYYLEFVSALLSATQRATGALKSAGEPSVGGGRQIADGLARAFDGASHKLARASTQAGTISTASASAFQLGASAVTAEIRAALQGIALVKPSESPELRAAAAKDTACQVLRS